MLLLAVVHATLLMHVYVHAEPDNLGFVSIDCGLSDPPHVDKVTNISYVSDDAYIATGEKHDISSGYPWQYKADRSLRSFPSGGRNCYTIPSAARGRKYLVRARFMHGDYDGGGKSLAVKPVKFDLNIGLDFWYKVTVSDAAIPYTAEAIAVTVASSLSVCLLDTGHGTPFISSLELRPMGSDMYTDATANQSLGLVTRINMGGAANTLRYPNDTHDRFWWSQVYIDITPSHNISTNDTRGMNYYSNDYIYVPEDVLRTAVTTSATSVPLNITQSPNWPTDWTYFHFLHFANFEQQLRQLDIYYGKNKWEYSPLSLSSMQPTYSPIVASLCNISIVATNTSVLPPMLNAIEIYFGIPRNDSATSPDDGNIYMPNINYIFV